MSKIKSFFNRHKKALAVFAVSASLMVISALSAFAEDTALTSVQTSFSDGLNAIKDQLLSYLAIGVPVAIVAVGAYFCVRKGVSFFLKLTRKD